MGQEQKGSINTGFIIEVDQTGNKVGYKIVADARIGYNVEMQGFNTEEDLLERAENKTAVEISSLIHLQCTSKVVAKCDYFRRVPSLVQPLSVRENKKP